MESLEEIARAVYKEGFSGRPVLVSETSRHQSSTPSQHNSPAAMEFQQIVDRIRAGQDPKFPANANSREYAETLNSQDPIKHLRDEFILPTRGSLKKKALTGVLPGTSPPFNPPTPRYLFRG
jgi:ketol-acid reductoisomerase